MKKCTIFLIFFLLISCKQSNVPTISVTVLSDKTDAHIPRPVSNQIMQFYNDANYVNSKKEFTYQEVTNTSVNPIYKAEYDPGSFWENQLHQKNAITDFEDQIDFILTSNQDTIEEYDNSSILRPLFRILKQLQENKNMHNVVLLYSDLLEANGLLNVYHFKTSRLLIGNPKSIALEIRNQIEPPKDINVDLYVIYTPKNMQDNLLFEKMVEVYQYLFEGTGVSIQIGISNRIDVKP